MELEMRIQRIYSAIQASTDTNVAGLTPTRVVDTKELYSAYYDFNGDLSEADLLNMAHSIIQNLANFPDHARKWLRDNRKSTDSIEEVIDTSTALKIAIDLSNLEKHVYPPRNGGRSGVSPKLTKVKRVLAMGEGGGMVLFSTEPTATSLQSGSASLVLDAKVIDSDGNSLGDFSKLMASAASDLEQFLTSQGLAIPPRKPPQIRPQISPPPTEKRQDSLGRAFHEKVAAQTVLIQRSYRDITGEWCEESATGVIIGHGKPQGNKFIKIATAGHLLTDALDNLINWRVSRTEIDPIGKSQVRVVEFVTSNALFHEPGMIRPVDCTHCDIGHFAIPNAAKDLDGNEFPFLDTTLHKPLRLSPRDGQPMPGARVAWAGFPSLVEERVGSHSLCYFEGIVSCVANQPPIYWIDGHVSNGVSGGPLWTCDATGKPMVIGIVANYTRLNASDVPGLAGFTPLQVLLNFLEDRSDSGIEWFPFCKCNDPNCIARRRKFPGLLKKNESSD